MVAVKKDLLQKPINRLRQALADDAAGREIDWVNHLRPGLWELIQAIRLHVAATEEPNGALATLSSPAQDTVATLDRQVKQLRHEHVELLDIAGRLSLCVDGISDRHIANVADDLDQPDIPFIQELANDFLERLQKHEVAEEKLYVAVISTDVGVGD